MKKFLLLTFVLLSLGHNALANVGICQKKMTALNLKENAWDIRHNRADVETTLLERKDVIQAIDDNNTDLEQSDIDRIMFYLNKSSIEFYSFSINVPAGSAATLVIVNAKTCAVLNRYSIFEE